MLTQTHRLICCLRGVGAIISCWVSSSDTQEDLTTPPCRYQLQVPTVRTSALRLPFPRQPRFTHGLFHRWPSSCLSQLLKDQTNTIVTFKKRPAEFKEPAALINRNFRREHKQGAFLWRMMSPTIFLILCQEKANETFCDLFTFRILVRFTDMEQNLSNVLNGKTACHISRQLQWANVQS